jgi:two-component system, cell cycle response regulator
MVMSLLEKYNKLKKEYEDYQKMAEKTMQEQSVKITELDRKLDMMSLIVEISQYVNKYLRNGEIVSTINDIMIGILGVTYSSVYLVENGELKLKVSNLKDTSHHVSIHEFNSGNIDKLKTHLINSKCNIYKGKENLGIHSLIYIPIYLNDDLLGAIVVEHKLYNYLSNEHIKLLTTISNQIAMSIENNRLYNKIRENSERDSLTKLFSRSYFFSIINKKVKDSKRGFAIVMIDIDNFKKCNDTFGHQYGDEVLRTVGSIIKKNIRSYDIAARYGGEEIIIYMYDINSKIDVYNRMCDIKDKIKNTPISYGKISSHVTVSVGVSISVKGSNKEDENVEKLIREADMNLYKAKNSGKDKVVC